MANHRLYLLPLFVAHYPSLYLPQLVLIQYRRRIGLKPVVEYRRRLAEPLQGLHF